MAQNGLIPVTYKRHSRKFWRRFTSFEFARHTSSCTIVASEILQVAATFPIAFQQSDKGVVPVALLTLVPRTPTPFVSQSGQWLAGYVPSALRCAPFHAFPTGKLAADRSERIQLWVDETLGLVTNDPKDEAFFAESGDLTCELQRVEAFFQARAAALKITHDMCKNIAGLGLFSPLARHDGIDLPPKLLGINARKLDDLSKAQSVELVKCGALRMVHAHQVSLSHCAWINRAHQQMSEKVQQEGNGADSDMTGFLSAMAHAQQAEAAFKLNMTESAHAAV